MGRRIKIKREPSTDPTVSVELRGMTYSVGDLVLVQHRSTQRWQELPIREIREESSGYVFFFYLAPPGWIAVGPDNIRPLRKKKGKKNVSKD